MQEYWTGWVKDLKDGLAMEQAIMDRFDTRVEKRPVSDHGVQDIDIRDLRNLPLQLNVNRASNDLKRVADMKAHLERTTSMTPSLDQDTKEIVKNGLNRLFLALMTHAKGQVCELQTATLKAIDDLRKEGLQEIQGERVHVILNALKDKCGDRKFERVRKLILDQIRRFNHDQNPGAEFDVKEVVTMFETLLQEVVRDNQAPIEPAAPAPQPVPATVTGGKRSRPDGTQAIEKRRELMRRAEKTQILKDLNLLDRRIETQLLAPDVGVATEMTNKSTDFRFLLRAGAAASFVRHTMKIFVILFGNVKPSSEHCIHEYDIDTMKCYAVDIGRIVKKMKKTWYDVESALNEVGLKVTTLHQDRLHSCYTGLLAAEKLAIGKAPLGEFLLEEAVMAYPKCHANCAPSVYTDPLELVQAYWEGLRNMTEALKPMYRNGGILSKPKNNHHKDAFFDEINDMCNSLSDDAHELLETVAKLSWISVYPLIVDKLQQEPETEREGFEM